MLDTGQPSAPSGMRAAPGETEAKPEGALFPDTLWTVVLMATQERTGAGAEALARLAGNYRDAVLHWFQRAGLAAEAAEDLTHDFLVEWLSGRVLGSYRRREARFRTFLQACLRNFLRDSQRRARAGKRGGGEAALPLEEAASVAVDGLSDSVLDGAVATIAHERALRSVREEWARAGWAERFEAFQSRLLGEETSGDHAEKADALGITVGHSRRILFELREAYYHALRREVAQTVAPGELEEEMRHLIQALAAVQASKPDAA